MVDAVVGLRSRTCDWQSISGRVEVSRRLRAESNASRLGLASREARFDGPVSRSVDTILTFIDTGLVWTSLPGCLCRSSPLRSLRSRTSRWCPAH